MSVQLGVCEGTIGLYTLSSPTEPLADTPVTENPKDRIGALVPVPNDAVADTPVAAKDMIAKGVTVPTADVPAEPVTAKDVPRLKPVLPTEPVPATPVTLTNPVAE